MENTFDFVPILNGVFSHAMTIPNFYFLAAFFVLFTLMTEIIMYWTGVYYKEKKELKKIEEERKIMHSKKAILAPKKIK